MRLYACPACGGAVYFPNLACTCGQALAYDPAADAMRAAGDVGLCANRNAIGCNWQAAGGDLCHACALTETVPDLSVAGNRGLWAEAEDAKRLVLAGLARWGWYAPSDQGAWPRFRLLSEKARHGNVPVVMGHADGLITINLAEADPAEREARRQGLGEPLRTMVGHFRHEIAHALFLRLEAKDGFTPAFRELMGDETADYGQAMDRHYNEGPPPDWAERHATAYASMHPHEDWAESAAHVMHLVDTTDSALAAGLSHSDLPPAGYDPYAERDSETAITYGVALGIATNHVNRSMGLDDLYPFVLSAAAREKLAFAHRWLSAGP